MDVKIPGLWTHAHATGEDGIFATAYVAAETAGRIEAT